MKKALVVSIVIASAAAVAQAGPVPTLSQAFSQLSQALKPAASRLAAAAGAGFHSVAVPQNVTFNLEWHNGRWHLMPDPNPPFSGLRIAVYAGQHVRLNLTNPVLADQDDGASFDVDGLDALVDGKPTHGIHVWLPVAVGQITVDFVAPSKESLFPIYATYSGASDGPVGQIVVLKP
ncbi:MAG TPA: hypothetical protein VNH15_06830 [Elusimicrobiota bacterium]|nr:hypothetical protein [Elusimicrobiota bacterium]